MKVVFVSNYYNHHQAALSQALERLTGGQYFFVQTEEMEQERVKLGWSIQIPAYVKCSYESKEVYRQCKKLIWEADVVIFGGSPSVEKLAQKRIKAGKLSFRYSERVYKNARTRRQLPLRAVKYHLCNFPYRNVYLLCASAYAAADYAKTGNFINKAYRWGYFPKVNRYERIDRLLEEKEPDTLLWAARLIDWKHPELCMEVAKRLKADGYTFKLRMIGTGEMETQLRDMIRQEGLQDQIELLGAMTPEQVRRHMEMSRIFLFTSDFGEGWGAVLNESMNSGCAVVASHAIGAAPYLIEDTENGLLYQNGSTEDLYRKVKYLLDNPEKSLEMGKKAYMTMAQTWNADTAAERFLSLAENLLSGSDARTLFPEGPCSKADNMENDWYVMGKS